MNKKKTFKKFRKLPLSSKKRKNSSKIQQFKMGMKIKNKRLGRLL
jgi:hypothetical protein